VTEQNLCGCAFGVNTRITYQNFRVSLAASFIDESGGFYPFWEKIDARFAWDAWGITIWLCGMG
jgi:hypothetical protein